MSNSVQGLVGNIGTSRPDGTSPILRLGNQADLIVSEMQGRLFEANLRGLLFNAANQAGAVTTVGLATTYTGLCLSNPVGNNKNVVLTGVGYAFPVAPAAAVVVGLMTGFSGSAQVTHTTPGTPRTSYIGAGAVPTALVDTAATLSATPVIERILGKVDTGAITVDTQGAVTNIPIEGGIILAPGAFVAFYTSSVANTAGFFGSFQWMELPLQ